MSKPFPLRAALVAAALLACAVSGAPRSRAGEAPVTAVVELFTSEGCSSCPPADAVFERLSREPGLLALSYHVDYWDSLGWRDTLGDRRFTQRQYGYARSFHRSGVYTPQAVVDGRDHAVGSDEPAVRRLMAHLAQAGDAPSVRVAVARHGGAPRVSLGPGGGPATVLLVRFAKEVRVAIGRGENGGRTVTYRNTVRSIDVVGTWTGAATTIALPPSAGQAVAGEGAAVLVQRYDAGGAPGAILGAAIVSGDGS